MLTEIDVRNVTFKGIRFAIGREELFYGINKKKIPHLFARYNRVLWREIPVERLTQDSRDRLDKIIEASQERVNDYRDRYARKKRKDRLAARQSAQAV